jgi:uracil-DNA glycosylase family 4
VTSPSVFPTPVPFEGPSSYKLICVGEAPGAEEVGQGRPFIGKTGQLLRRYLERQGCEVDLTTIMFANLCKYRPRKANQFSTILNTPELESGLNDLKEEIDRVKPNLILALGGWPTYYITGKCGYRQKKPIPGSGIKLYRGSLLPALDDFSNIKTLCSYHPSYIERDWKWNPVFFWDLQRAAQDMQFPELRYTEYDEFIDPPADVLDELTEESIKSEWTSVDIETFPGGRFSCVGWAYRRPKTGKFAGVCITYKRPDLWKWARRMWEAGGPKIFQYGTYDVSFMQYFYDWKVGGFYDGVGWDTYVASANLLPDFPRGLDFLISIYTRFPYYKTERKVWREMGDMSILWKYNIKDTVGTHEVADYQMNEMGKLYANTA